MSKLSRAFEALRVTILPEDEQPKATRGKCCTCNKWFAIADLSGFWESESWEMPKEYYVYECPDCEDGGCVCDYE